MQHNVRNRILDACNHCILSCEACVKEARIALHACAENSCDASASLYVKRAKSCIDACRRCIDECNEGIKQTQGEEHDIIRKCIKSCGECIRACESGIDSCSAMIKCAIALKESIELCNECISACDECIEHLGIKGL
jgi:hypothetical protein